MSGDQLILLVSWEYGDSVTVDFDICIGDGACIEACPVNVYEWLETPGHEGSERKPFMAREKDCIFCLAIKGFLSEPS